MANGAHGAHSAHTAPLWVFLRGVVRSCNKKNLSTEKSVITVHKMPKSGHKMSWKITEGHVKATIPSKRARKGLKERLEIIVVVIIIIMKCMSIIKGPMSII